MPKPTDCCSKLCICHAVGVALENAADHFRNLAAVQGIDKSVASARRHLVDSQARRALLVSRASLELDAADA